jgi:catechol 1,2-dioxygenase
MKINRRTAIKTTILSGFGLLLGKSVLAQECLTTADIEEPYYIPGAPLSAKLSPSGAPGAPLFITGSVYARDCVTPIENAEVDVWHANDAGGYENDNYRGIIKTDGSGKYAFETILPGKYLNGAQYRPRHLHYKVSAPELHAGLVLTTQIYFEGDTSIPNDPWASDPKAEDRIITLSTDGQGAEHGVADFVIDVEPAPNAVTTLPSSQYAAIQSIYPNPVSTSAEIHISLTHTGSVSLTVFNLMGHAVNSLLNNKLLGRGKHKLPLMPQNRNGLRLPPGIYIIKREQDGMAQDVKRIVVQ